MSVSKQITVTLDGVQYTRSIRAFDETSSWDGPALEPDGSPELPRPVPLTPTEVAGMTWEDVFVGPGHAGTPAGRTYTGATAWEDMLADLASEGITPSDNLRINGVPGSAGMWDFNAVTDPDVGQAGTITLGAERNGTGWTLIQPDDVSGLPTPDANVKGVVSNLGSRIDPSGDLSTGERSKLLWIERQATAAHVIIIGLNAKRVQFRGIMTRPRAGDAHPVVYHVTMPTDPGFDTIPDEIHFQQVIIDAGGVDFDFNNGCSFGIVTRANNCSVTDSYICGVSGPAGRESKALVHGCGKGFLARNNFLQATAIIGGCGFQNTSDQRVVAFSSSWEWNHGYKEIQSTNGPWVGKGGLEAKGVRVWLVEGYVHEHMPVAANASSSDATNTQMVGVKGFNDTYPGGSNPPLSSFSPQHLGMSHDIIFRWCFGDGCLKAFYVQPLGASGGYRSWCATGVSIHDLLCVNHGGDADIAINGTAFNPSGDVSNYSLNANVGTLTTDYDGVTQRVGSWEVDVRGLTVIAPTAGAIPVNGSAPVRHFLYLGAWAGAAVYEDGAHSAFSDIIGPATMWGNFGDGPSPPGYGANKHLEAGGSWANAESSFLMGGLTALAGEDWFPEADPDQYIGSDGMLTAAGAAAWRAAAGLGGSAPICTQTPRKMPDGTMFTPAADKPGCDVPRLASLIGGVYPNLGSNVKSPTILYP